MDSTEQLIKENEGLIYEVIYKMFKTRSKIEINRRLKKQGLTIEDLAQEGRISFLKAIENYKETDDGASLATYAFHSIRYNLIDTLKVGYLLKLPWNMKHEEKMKYLNKVQSSDMLIGDKDDFSISDTLQHNETGYNKSILKNDISKALNKLDERSRDIVIRKMNEESVRSIGRDYGITFQRVSQIHRQALEKLKGELKDYENVV